MSQNYPAYYDELNSIIGKYGKENPEVMGAFMKLHQAGSKDGELKSYIKELIALGISISTKCDGCITMIAAMKYWVTTADIDGYRCDAADFVPFDFWQQAITAFKGATKKNLILLAEGSRGDHFIAGFQMNYGWDFLASLKSVFGSNQDAGALFVTNTAEYSVVPSGCRKLRFTTNHDESNIATPVSVFGGNNGALAASVIAIFLQGAPLIYSGQEVGVSSTLVYNGGGPISWSDNPNMLASYTTMLNFYDSSAAARNGTLTTYTDRNVVVFQKVSGTGHGVE